MKKFRPYLIGIAIFAGFINFILESKKIDEIYKRVPTPDLKTIKSELNPYKYISYVLFIILSIIGISFFFDKKNN